MDTQITRVIERDQKIIINNEIAVFERVFIRDIELNRLHMEEHSRHSALVEKIKNPTLPNDLLEEQLVGINVMANQQEIILLNDKSNVVYANKEKTKNEYNTNEHYQDILSGRKTSVTYIKQDNDVYYIESMVPIRDEGKIIGGLVINYPIVEALERVYDYNDGSNTFFNIYKWDKKIASIGKKTTGKKYYKHIDELNITLEFITDQAVIDQQSRTISLYSILSSILSTSISAAILYLIAKVWILDPICAINASIDKFSEDSKITKPDENEMIIEINELSEKFYNLAKLIQMREKQLHSSFKKLESKNKKLKIAYKNLEKAQAVLIKQEKMASIGHLAAGVAHELNNPIAFIRANFNVLEEYFMTLCEYLNSLQKSNEEIDLILEDLPELIADSEEGLERVREIVQDLRDYSRVDEEKYGDYNLNKGIESTLKIAKSEYRYVAKVEKKLGDIPLFKANGNEVNEVILNLIINAAHAIKALDQEEKGIIRIETYAKEGKIFFAIEDTGAGIPEETLTHIFNPFFTTKEPGKGTGMGLYISYDIVHNKHNGEIKVSSEVGKGSKFTVILPVDEKELPYEK